MQMQVATLLFHAVSSFETYRCILVYWYLLDMSVESKGDESNEIDGKCKDA